MAEKIRVELEKERDTKNTTRYKETVDGDESPVIGTLYLQSSAVEELGQPSALIVEVKAKP